jgi:Rhodopirellula transposase DDE domain
VGQYWQSSGLLASLQQQVHVNRGRMGHYEVYDFILLLLAYAVSGLDTLVEFFEQLKSVSSVLMAAWGRNQCTVAATLSRFLAAVTADSVEALRTLLETDLWMHPLPHTQELDVRDVASIRAWWDEMGTQLYADATELMIMADCGGSNDYQSWLWKAELQISADEIGLTIEICHFPPGTSQWNKIEYRMFSQISQNWRWQPLTSRAVVCNASLKLD